LKIDQPLKFSFDLAFKHDCCNPLTTCLPFLHIEPLKTDENAATSPHEIFVEIIAEFFLKLPPSHLRILLILPDSPYVGYGFFPMVLGPFRNRINALPKQRKWIHAQYTREW
jgi:hypothetical protein